ncbi:MULTISPECIES: hypothetical protein [Citrobacter]|uniref:hypothetical protein n=1 Tax=Citrobacter TaxID=544 RepID=UPI0012496458|nr:MULTISPECIES: hypothetical protein [unclassified Citrobacter]MBC6502971.1 hypothetical protein [Citrobacter freundii]MBC6507994.1 hypothetical protein [Citrobacter freundii]MBP8542501.1 hypothetical protein [Citrobacter sp. On2M]MBW5273249.1 hypothetical protein [Citrobacter sp. On28M]MDG5478526.1 hypothetical protein [Citrobacter freundii]
MKNIQSRDEKVYRRMVSDTMVGFMNTMGDLSDEAKDDLLSIIVEAMETNANEDEESRRKINLKVHEVSKEYNIPILNIFSVISMVFIDFEY